MAELRILITGSRHLTSLPTVRDALLDAHRRFGCPRLVTVVHGNQRGGDLLADTVARSLGWTPEPHDVTDFARHGRDRFRARNQYMVSLGANFCVVIADRWASGTGMCARMARRAGIQTVDYGVSTKERARACPR